MDEEMKKIAMQLPKGRQRPIKTECNSRSVIFTYFQGDTNSVVDEHFSRALSNFKKPQGLSPSSQSEDVILRNDSDMPPNQWRFSSPWTKSRLEVSLANSASSSSASVSGPTAINQYPLSLPETSAQPGELWHFSSLVSHSSPEPGYTHAFSDGHLAPEPRSDGKCEPLLSLLQQDRCLSCPQESIMREDCSPVQIPGSTGLLLSLPSGSASCKKIYVSPSRGPTTPSLANEIPDKCAKDRRQCLPLRIPHGFSPLVHTGGRDHVEQKTYQSQKVGQRGLEERHSGGSQSPERRKDLFFY